MGARNAWLGCPGSVCDLRTCPSNNNYYRIFNGQICWGEEFQIISDGTQGSAIKSGQQIRLRYLREHNSWMGCRSKNRCDKRTCPGTTSQGSASEIVGVGEKSSEYMLVGELMDKQYTMVMW